MITKYQGVFCVASDCRRFIPQLTPYQVERPEQIQDSWMWFEPTVPITCPHCGDKCHYTKFDVAHVTSLDGANPQFPNRK
jgi:hypothetical protein